MNRPSKRDSRRRAKPETPRHLATQALILKYLEDRFEQTHGRRPEPGDVLLEDEDGSIYLKGPRPL